MSKALSRKTRRKAAANLVRELDSSLFKALGEPCRVEILKFLMLNGSSDIGTIAKSMPQDRSVVSRHLNMMLQAGLVISDKRGRHAYFDLDSRFFLEKFEAMAAEIRQCMSECGILVEPMV